jgi:hypothetical protein
MNANSARKWYDAFLFYFKAIVAQVKAGVYELTKQMLYPYSIYR